MANLVLKVKGPFRIPYYAGKGGRTITDDNVEAFWESNSKYAKRKGCYVFGIRAGKGYTPGYVGKATNTFKGEVFQHHKLTRYHQFLADYAKATPVLFLLVAPVKQGKPNSSRISAIEKYLIDIALAANPDLMNQRGTKVPGWGIQGVIRGEQGKVSAATSDFRKMLGLN
jgi:hypothetical protein